MADAKTAKTAKATEAPEEKAAQAEQTEQRRKNALYGQAQRELRNRHEAEFIQIIEGLYAAEGLTYRKRLSPDEKAAKQVSDLLEQYPHLRDTLVGAPDGNA